MALGIYKPGQGYWVRVLTAVGAGVLTLLTAAWIWEQVGLIDLPAKGHQLILTGAGGELVQGAVVRAFVENEETGVEEEVGTLTVESFAPSELSPEAVVKPAALNAGVDVAAIDSIRGDGFEARVAQLRDIPVVEPMYVQGGASSLVILAGAALTFLLAGVRPGSCEFLIATDGEMKKVNWSTRREVIGSTTVVIGASVLLAVILYVVDYGFQVFFTAIDVLQR